MGSAFIHSIDPCVCVCAGKKILFVHIEYKGIEYIEIHGQMNSIFNVFKKWGAKDIKQLYIYENFFYGKIEISLKEKNNNNMDTKPKQWH